MGQTQTKKKKTNDNIRKLIRSESKKEYFIRNGAILLEHQVRISEGRDIGARELKIFSNKEIEKATNNYDENAITHTLSFFQKRIQANVYKATINNHIVASVLVPTSLDPNPELSKNFLNGVSTIMVMNHKNILKIYGCCLDTCIPMVVCEYLLNATPFFQCLHCDTPTKCMVWRDQMRVVTEIAYALSYMHNALPKTLVHRNVSSSSIYLDSSNIAKLTRFGYTVSVTPGDTSKRWPIEGTMGYIDPEYIETQRVTDKCDVYSLGVLMIEILTRRQPFMMARDGINLIDMFVAAVEENRMKDMIDRKVLEQACWNEIQQVVRLALACVAKKGTNRPIMIDVVGELRKILTRDN